MIKIKVCGMRDSLNIKEICNAGPDYLGIIFFSGSKRYVGPDADNTPFQQIPGRIKKVGVFVDEQPEKMLKTAYRFDLDLIQLHGHESVNDCRKIKSAGYPVIKAFGVDAGFNFTSLAPFLQFCDYFLFDTKSVQYGGTGQKFDWGKILQYKYNVPFFLSGGIGPDDSAVIREINHPAFFAVDINSRFETEPGLKNVSHVKAFIKEIKKVIL